MILNDVICMLAMAGPRDGQESTAPFWVNLMPIILMFVVFYFLLIRPQTKKAREHDQLLKSLKGGMWVVTSSGIRGRIITVRDNSPYATLRSADTKLEVLKSSITSVLEKGDDESESSNGNK